MAVRGFVDGLTKTVGALLGLAMAVAGAWFWIWWLPNSLAAWIGGPEWLWVVLVLLVLLPAMEFILGLVAFVLILPALAVKAVGRRKRTQRSGKRGGVKYQAECYVVDRPGGFPQGPTLVDGEAAAGNNPAIGHGAKAVRRSLELGVPVEVEPGVGWHLLAEANGDPDPVAPTLAGLVHSGVDRVLTVRLWPPTANPGDTSPPAAMTVALEDAEVRIAYIDEEPERALLQLVAGSVAEYWRRTADSETNLERRKDKSVG